MDEFASEFDDLHQDIQDEILAMSDLLKRFGPYLGRPHVDTLNNPQHPNMKEMRFSANGGEWRVAFAFDPKRKGILLVAGDKSGGSGQRFYKDLIRKANKRFNQHLAPACRLMEEGGSSWW